MRTGIIGLGDRSGHLVTAFHTIIPNCQFVAYADPQPARLGALEAKGIPMGQGYASHLDMLRQERLDLVIVASPNHLHLEHIRACLNAGVRVFAEKPVVRTEAESFLLMDLLKVHGRDAVMVGLVLRYAPLYKALMAALRAGQLGDVLSLEAAEHIAPEHGAFFHRDWRRHQDHSGGFMLEKCCHDLDIYNSVMGCRPRRVASFGGKRHFVAARQALESDPVYHQRQSRWGGGERAFGSDSDIVDHQVALLEYENGAQMAFHTNMNVPDEYRRFCVVGTDGMAEGDFVRNFLKVHDARSAACLLDTNFALGDPTVSIHYGAEELMAQEVHEHLHLGQPLPVSVLDALTAGLTAIKLDEARVMGQVLDLSPMWDRFDAYAL
ncbi:Gfo/Idh/MocA family protein [Roseateles sp. BYS180W]|uniref:Gfo/Idh/MocA family protein n=1 Tax=Roseateles rivi TaxID=3299028 RepID=A0ABW7FV18_9BURK